MDDFPLSTSSSFTPIRPGTVELNPSLLSSETQRQLLPPGKEDHSSQTNSVINIPGSFFNDFETTDEGNNAALHLQQKEKEANVLGKTDVTIADHSSNSKFDGFGIPTTDTSTKGTLKDRSEKANPKPLQCSICKTIFTSHLGLSYHVNRRVCERSYFDASQLHQCTSCGCRFTRRSCLLAHSEQSPCQREIHRKSLLINKVTNRNRILVLTKLFNRRGSLKKRITATKSKAPRMFHCKHEAGCDKAYSSEVALRAHAQLHRMESDLSNQLPQVQQLDVAPVDLSNISKKCGITFVQEESMKEQMIAKHKRKNRKKSSRQFRCNLCGQKYKILGWMKQHMKVKHPTEAADDFTETTQGLNSESQFSKEISSPIGVANNENYDVQADVVQFESDLVQLEEVHYSQQPDHQEPAVNQSLNPETMFMEHSAGNLYDDDSSNEIDQLKTNRINLLESLDNTMYVCKNCGQVYKSLDCMIKHSERMHPTIENQNDFLEIIIDLVTDDPSKQPLLESSQTCATSVENDSNELLFW